MAGPQWAVGVERNRVWLRIQIILWECEGGASVRWEGGARGVSAAIFQDRSDWWIRLGYGRTARMGRAERVRRAERITY